MRKETKQELFRKLGYNPHSLEQEQCHYSSARFKIPCCGRRWGKTTFGGNELTAAALDMEKPEGYYWIVGPDYALGEKEFRVVYNNLVSKLKLGARIKKTYQPLQGNMSITMPWGTHIEVKSAERKDRLIGEGLDGVVMAEAATHDADTWEQYVEPALTDKRGWAIFPSTPKGYNWYQGLWFMGQMPDFPEYESWRLPTWTNKAMFPGGYDDPEMARLRRKLPEIVWMQEYAADFVMYQGKVYTEFNPKVHVQDISYNPFWKNYLFFDYGFVDPFVCLDVMVDPMDNYYVWREYQVSGMTTWEHGKVIRNRDNPEGYHVDGMFGDPRGPDEAATLGLILGPVISSAVPWKVAVTEVKEQMKLQPDGTSRFHIDGSCTESIRQFERLRYKQVQGERNAKEEQHDYDDHGPDAYRYGVGQLAVVGQGPRLSDIYNRSLRKSEAYSFFTRQQAITTEKLDWR
jgi:hypothetical protein